MDDKYIDVLKKSILNPEIVKQIGKDLKIKEASDGNGGTYSSLRASGCLADMKEKGIKWIFVGGVDNVLLKMTDVTFLGMDKDCGAFICLF